MTREFGRRPAKSAAAPASIAAASRAEFDDGAAADDFVSRIPWLAAVQVAAAALIGFAIILRIAANWDDIGKVARFAIVGAVLTAALAASLVPRVRIPALLVAFLAVGGLLALIGQTYQTGADHWSLFAMWAVLTLPWAFAARHDAVWLAWAVVGMTAVELWHSGAGIGFLARADVSHAAVSWIIGLGIAALLSPWSPMRPWTGEARWAFRIVTLLIVAMVTKDGVWAVFARSTGELSFAALLVLALLAVALMLLEPLDLVLLAMTALGFDIVLIAWGAHAVPWAASFSSGVLFVGLLSAGIVGGTGAVILHVARESGDVRIPGMPGGAAGANWPAIFLTGVGALLAAFPLLVFLGLTFGALLGAGSGVYLLGIMALVASAFVLRTASQESFMHQLGVIGLVVGFSLLGFGLLRDARGQTAIPSLMLALTATGLVLVVGRTWVVSLLGVAAAVFIAMFIGSLSRAPLLWVPSGPSWAIVLAIASAALLSLESAHAGSSSVT